MKNTAQSNPSQNFRLQLYLLDKKQESLANAKVSVRQQCVYMYEGPIAMKSMTNQRREQMGYNSLAIFIRLAVVMSQSQICEILRNSSKIRTYSSSRSSRVTDLGVNRKRICNFLLVIRK